MDRLPYANLLVKLNEYARSQRLDGEASRGKQAVDLNKANRWADEEAPAKDNEEPEELKAPASVKRYSCNKNIILQSAR